MMPPHSTITVWTENCFSRQTWNKIQRDQLNGATTKAVSGNKIKIVTMSKVPRKLTGSQNPPVDLSNPGLAKWRCSGYGHWIWLSPRGNCLELATSGSALLCSAHVNNPLLSIPPSDMNHLPFIWSIPFPWKRLWRRRRYIVWSRECPFQT